MMLLLLKFGVLFYLIELLSVTGLWHRRVSTICIEHNEFEKRIRTAIRG